MQLCVFINGFGRIGRLIVRDIIKRSLPIRVVGINSISSIESAAHLMKYDTVHGVSDSDVSVDGEYLVIDGMRIRYTRAYSPLELDLRDVHCVYECSGAFTSREVASMHLNAGAHRVLVSAPVSDADFTVVYGFNHEQMRAEHRILSNASCTTNCVAHVIALVDEMCGIDGGFISTTHAYTADQCLVDGSHKDMRRARAAALNICPTTTGVTGAIGSLFPHLSGRVDGISLRVPVSNVSIAQMSFVVRDMVSATDVNTFLRENIRYADVLKVEEAQLVSSDYIGSTYSAIVDAALTKVVPLCGGSRGCIVNVAAWYDNEYAFACRMNDVSQYGFKIY